MSGKLIKAYYQHLKNHVPDLSHTSVSEAEERIRIIEDNMRSPLRKQMSKEARQRSSLDARTAIEAYTKHIKRFTT